MTPDGVVLRVTQTGIRVELRVTPRAAKTSLGVRDGRLLARVTAPPVDDAANEAVRRLLADALDVPMRSVRIASGASARSKSVEITGLSQSELARRLNAALSPKPHIMRSAT